MQSGQVIASKNEAGYWVRRLFKNTFTYKGKRRQVNGWSVKIQLFGQRRTFALGSSDLTAAAAEACQIYRTICTQGWDATNHRSLRAGLATKQSANIPALASAQDPTPWVSRLIHRRHPEPTDGQTQRELSVRIEHLGINRYFPLGTDDESKAAVEAMNIHDQVVVLGWAEAGQRHARELTLALRWLDSPLAWTYTTIHTWRSTDPLPEFAEPDPKSADCHVAILEPDAGIRHALAACTNRQRGFRCCACWANLTEALEDISHTRVDLVLINFALPDQAGAAAFEALQRSRSRLVGLLYSDFEDSDQLFKATPGGAAGYLLKRTPSHRLFEPIAAPTGPVTREIVATRLREYFQQVAAALPSGPSALATAKLTPREHEILSLLAKGQLAKEIAEALGISIWTVHGHVKSIFEKLDVHTRTEAVVKFLQK